MNGNGPMYSALYEHLLVRGYPHDVCRRALRSLPTLVDVLVERANQEIKWGPQTHPDGTGPTVPAPDYLAVDTMDDARVIATQVVEDRVADGESVTWMDIASEEFYEAGAATGKDLGVELVQNAAVFVAWATDARTRPND